MLVSSPVRYDAVVVITITALDLVWYTVFLSAGIDWENSSVYKRYIVSLYWAVTTITSVGYAPAVYYVS